MNVRRPLAQMTKIHVHSVVFYGDMSFISKYKIGYKVPAISFQFNRNIEMMKSVYFGKRSNFAIESELPQEITLYLTFRKESNEFVSSRLLITIESSEYNYITSSGQIQLDNIFKGNISAVTTFYVQTNYRNPIILNGFKLYQLQFKSLKPIRRNIYKLRDYAIVKGVRSSTFNDFGDESMRDVLPFYELAPHDCIIRLMGYSHINDHLCLILEKCGDSLDKHIKRRDLDNEKIIKIILCVCCGLIHMHQHNYIHRDIKPGNIIVTERGEAKLIDFGISRPYNEDDLTSSTGTMRYIAPEVITDSYDFRCDIYSLGVVILEMITDVNVSDFIEGKELKNVPHITQVILRSILSPDPSKRPTLDEIILTIYNNTFYLVQNICDHNKELFENNEKRIEEEKFCILEKNYFTTVSESRNDFNLLLKKDDGFFFHFGVILYFNFKEEKACDVFYIGHLLGDEYCGYMIEAMSRKEMIVAHNVETMDIDMTKWFLSFSANDIRTFVLPFKFEPNFKVVNKIINPENSLASEYFSLKFNDYFIDEIYDHYKEICRHPSIEQSDLNYNDLFTNLREGNISLLDCYLIIYYLYCLGIKSWYLIYFALLTRNEEFIGCIIYMFGKKRDKIEAYQHLMRSKSYHSFSVISLILMDIGFDDQDFATQLYLLGIDRKFYFLHSLTSEDDNILKEYYGWKHYLLTGIDYLMKENFAHRINYSFSSYLSKGCFKEARELLKETIMDQTDFNFFKIYLALVKFGEGDLNNGLLNLNWIPKDYSLGQLVIGIFYLHGYKLPKNKDLGLEYIKAASIDESLAKMEYAMLNLRGVYVEQNVDLALSYFSQIVDEFPEAQDYISNIKAGNNYFFNGNDLFSRLLIQELQLSEDFIPIYSNCYEFGILEQSDSFYLRHAKFQNPLAIYCYAHCVETVDEAINLLEQSSLYELEISFNELAYLYLVYKHDLAKTKHYSNIGSRLGYLESQMIFQNIYLINEKEEIIKGNEGGVSEMEYSYRFEQYEDEYFDYRISILFDSFYKYRKN